MNWRSPSGWSASDASDNDLLKLLRRCRHRRAAPSRLVSSSVSSTVCCSPRGPRYLCSGHLLGAPHQRRDRAGGDGSRHRTPHLRAAMTSTSHLGGGDQRARGPGLDAVLAVGVQRHRRQGARAAGAGVTVERMSRVRIEPVQHGSTGGAALARGSCCAPGPSGAGRRADYQVVPNTAKEAQSAGRRRAPCASRTSSIARRSASGGDCSRRRDTNDVMSAVVALSFTLQRLITT